MGFKSTMEWVRNEWPVFRRKEDMAPGERARWVKQWVPFGLRTIGWSTLSLTGGALTRGRASTWAATQWSRSSARGLNIRIEPSGLESIPEGGVVFASNHESLIDILILGAVLPGDFKWAAKRSLMNVPFLGWHLRLAGHIAVDRNQGHHAAQAVVDAFTSVLDEGLPLLVFPEGTRTEDGKLRPFKNGAFQAAVITNTPVGPIALSGTFALMSRHAVDTGSSRDPEVNRVVTVRVGKPIYPIAELENEDRVADLRDRTREAIIALKQETHPEQPAEETTAPS